MQGKGRLACQCAGLVRCDFNDLRRPPRDVLCPVLQPGIVRPLIVRPLLSYKTKNPPATAGFLRGRRHVGTAWPVSRSIAKPRSRIFRRAPHVCRAVRRLLWRSSRSPHEMMSPSHSATVRLLMGSAGDCFGPLRDVRREEALGQNLDLATRMASSSSSTPARSYSEVP